MGLFSDKSDRINGGWTDTEGPGGNPNEGPDGKPTVFAKPETTHHRPTDYDRGYIAGLRHRQGRIAGETVCFKAGFADGAWAKKSGACAYEPPKDER